MSSLGSRIRGKECCIDMTGFTMFDRINLIQDLITEGEKQLGFKIEFSHDAKGFEYECLVRVHTDDDYHYQLLIPCNCGKRELIDRFRAFFYSVSESEEHRKTETNKMKLDRFIEKQKDKGYEISFKVVDSLLRVTIAAYGKTYEHFYTFTKLTDEEELISELQEFIEQIETGHMAIYKALSFSELGEANSED